LDKLLLYGAELREK